MQTPKIVIPVKGLKGTRGKCEHANTPGEHISKRDFNNNPAMEACRCMLCGHFWSQSKLKKEDVEERKREKNREYMKNLYWERKGDAPSQRKVKKLLPEDEKVYQSMLVNNAPPEEIRKFRQKALRKLRKELGSQSSEEGSSSSQLEN